MIVDFGLRIVDFESSVTQSIAMDNHQPSAIQKRKSCRRFHRQAGLSLVEMLVSLAITAALLTATMVAIDTSFKAYAIAAESASTQTATRLVVNRVLTMVRTSLAHGPLLAETGVTVSNNVVTSPYLELIPPELQSGRLYRLTYDQTNQEIVLTEIDFSGAAEVVIQTQPVIGGVTDCEFQLLRRRDNDGVWVLERGSIDFTVEADDDSSLDIEVGDVPPVRVVASTKPRRLD